MENDVQNNEIEMTDPQPPHQKTNLIVQYNSQNNHPTFSHLKRKQTDHEKVLRKWRNYLPVVGDVRTYVGVYQVGTGV